MVKYKKGDGAAAAGRRPDMDSYGKLNEVLVELFNETLDIERRYVEKGDFKDISVNDMHILDAVGIKGEKSMSSIARLVGVTVGTLTIAMNSLVKKGYVMRSRSEKTAGSF